MAETFIEMTTRVDKGRGRLRLAAAHVAEALRTDPDDADDLKLHTNTAAQLLSEGYTILAGEKGAAA